MSSQTDALISFDFSKFIEDGDEAVAVAVSGGPDSMALCYALSDWAQERNVRIHALTVDHGLRQDARAEAEQVGHWAEDWPHVQHHILTWDHDGVEARVQEEARRARYDLIAAFCSGHGIQTVFTAHHMDDQAETVLFRLSKGSGLDGLAGMRVVQRLESGLRLVRPFLDVSKAALLELCRHHGVFYMDDPSNQNDDFARVRLREARTILEAEGLSNKRLAVTAKRLRRAQEALEDAAQKCYGRAVFKYDLNRIEFKKDLLFAHADEIVLRCLLRGMQHVAGAGGYGPRMEKLEALLVEITAVQPFRKRTLGGVIFERDDQGGLVILKRE